MGRTQLQDAVPMTLGQEFEAYAVTLEEEIMRLNETRNFSWKLTWAQPPSEPELFRSGIQ